MSRESDPTPKPLPERRADEILLAVLELFWIVRIEEHRARGALYVIGDRGAITKKGVVTTYIERELPMREATELLAWTLRGYPVGHTWRWRLCLCPAHQRTREGIHLLLMEPPKKGRPWSEPVWMRPGEADQRGRRRPEPGSLATTRSRRPKTTETAHDAQPPRATMGAEL